MGLRKLEELGIETKRPSDYFAEMVKTDNHMRKVRESLLSQQKILEQKEKSRKLRELKKYGKKVCTCVCVAATLYVGRCIANDSTIDHVLKANG